LANERWGSTHHLHFQQGVAAVLRGNAVDARSHLADATSLYEKDGREWRAGKIDQAQQLLEALAAGNAMQLLDRWELANRKAHGI